MNNTSSHLTDFNSKSYQACLWATLQTPSPPLPALCTPPLFPLHSRPLPITTFFLLPATSHFREQHQPPSSHIYPHSQLSVSLHIHTHPSLLATLLGCSNPLNCSTRLEFILPLYKQENWLRGSFIYLVNIIDHPLCTWLYAGHQTPIFIKLII